MGDERVRERFTRRRVEEERRCKDGSDLITHQT